MKVYGKSFAGEFRLYLKTFLFGETDPQLDGEIIFPREKPAPIETFPTAPRDAGKFRRIKICRVLWPCVHVQSASEKRDQAAATPTEGQKQRLIFFLSLCASLFSLAFVISGLQRVLRTNERSNRTRRRKTDASALLSSLPCRSQSLIWTGGGKGGKRETRCSKTRASKIEGPWRGRGDHGFAELYLQAIHFRT